MSVCKWTAVIARLTKPTHMTRLIVVISSALLTFCNRQHPVMRELYRSLSEHYFEHLCVRDKRAEAQRVWGGGESGWFDCQNTQFAVRLTGSLASSPHFRILRKKKYELETHKQVLC